MFRLNIPDILPGMNEIIQASRANKYVAAEQKKEYTDIIAWAAKAARIPHMERIDVAIHWYEPDKRRDKDNIMAGTKFIFDGLVRAGVIKNDGWKQIGDIQHFFDIDRRNPRVEVDITEIKEVV